MPVGLDNELKNSLEPSASINATINTAKYVRL